MQQWKQGPGHVELFAMLLHVPCFLGTCTVHFWLHYSADIALPPSGSHSLSSFSLSQCLHRSTSVHRNRRSGPTLAHATYDAHPPSSDLPHPDTHLFPSPASISHCLYHPKQRLLYTVLRVSSCLLEIIKPRKKNLEVRDKKKVSLSSDFFFYGNEAIFCFALFMFFFCLFQ